MFVAGTTDVTVVVPATGVEDAYDILVAGGVTAQKAADIAVGAARIGKDPVQFAHKFLRAQQAVS